jgi:hypothetical protein
MGSSIGPKGPGVPSVPTAETTESKQTNHAAPVKKQEPTPANEKSMNDAARKGAKDNAALQNVSGQAKNRELQLKLAEEKALKDFKDQQKKINEMELAADKLPGVLREGMKKLITVEEQKLNDLRKEHDRRVEERIGTMPKYDPSKAPQGPPQKPMTPEEKLLDHKAKMFEKMLQEKLRQMR